MSAATYLLSYQDQSQILWFHWSGSFQKEDDFSINHIRLSMLITSLPYYAISNGVHLGSETVLILISWRWRQGYSFQDQIISVANKDMYIFDKHTVWDRLWSMSSKSMSHTSTPIKSTHLLFCPVPRLEIPLTSTLPFITPSQRKQSRSKMKLSFSLSLLFAIVALLTTCQACSTTPLSAAGNFD